MSWSEIALGEIAEFRNGLNYTKLNEGKGIKVINVKDFKNRFYPAYETLEEINPIGIVSKQSILLDGDIVFVRSNGNKDLVGRSIYIDRPEEEVSFSGFCIRLRFKRKKLLPKFYAHFFRSPLFRKRLSLLGSGTNISNLNQKVLSGVKVPTPPLVAQQRILSILENYNDHIENNRRRIQLLEESARLLYKEWFVHLRFPGHEHVAVHDGVPEGWERKEISQVCETLGGGTPSTKNPEYWTDGDVTWVVPTDVTRNNCLALLDSEKKITESGLRNSSAKLVPAETILMTSRASVGFFALMNKEVATNQGFINIIPHNEIARMYILYNLMYRVEEIRAHAGGSTYKEISKGKFRKLSIVVPPKKLLREFHETTYKIHQQVRVLQQQRTKLEKARDLLLPRLMNGEIAV